MINVNMFKVTTTWPGRAIAPRVSFHESSDEADRAAAYWPNSVSAVEQCTAGVFEPGDTISVELHRGSTENDDGIRRGGQWISARGVVRSVSGAGGYVSASVWTEDGSHLQEMSAIAGLSGYPFRNAALAA